MTIYIECPECGADVQEDDIEDGKCQGCYDREALSDDDDVEVEV